MDDGLAERRIDALARYWKSASKEARFALLRDTFHAPKTPHALRELQLAIYLAEAEAGEIGEG